MKENKNIYVKGEDGRNVALMALFHVLEQNKYNKILYINDL